MKYTALRARLRRIEEAMGLVGEVIVITGGIPADAPAPVGAPPEAEPVADGLSHGTTPVDPRFCGQELCRDFCDPACGY
jgi:hypothetical protein